MCYCLSIFLLLWLFIAVSWVAAQSAIPADQHAALMTVFSGLRCNDSYSCRRFATTAACPTDGSSQSPLKCTPAGVTQLIIESPTPLLGSISPALGTLTMLTLLKIGQSSFRNGLVSTLPSEIGRLTNLTFLSIAYSNVTGTVPTELLLLTKLKSLLLTENLLTGPIPRPLPSVTSCWLQRSLATETNCFESCNSLPAICECNSTYGCATVAVTSRLTTMLRVTASTTTNTNTTTTTYTTATATTIANTTTELATVITEGTTTHQSSVDNASTTLPDTTPTTNEILALTSTDPLTGSNLQNATTSPLANNSGDASALLVGGIAAVVIALIILIAVVATLVWHRNWRNRDNAHVSVQPANDYGALPVHPVETRVGTDYDFALVDPVAATHYSSPTVLSS
jgi:membrane protein implicated in regulation of membrane protease activity